MGGAQPILCAWIGVSSCLFSIFPGAAQPTAQPKRFVVKGTLLDKETQAPIPYAHAYTFDRAFFSLSDETGNFSLKVRIPDTLVVSAVGYHTRFIHLTDPSTLQKGRKNIAMERQRVTLEEVIVYGRDPMEGFYTHERGRIPAEKALGRGPGISLGGRAPTEGVGLVIEGALTAIANRFNATYRQLEKLEKIKRESLLAAYYTRKLEERIPNALFVRHTNFLKEERDVFFSFWQPTLYFLEYTSEYAIVQRLREKEADYIAHLLRIKAYKAYPERITSLELRALLRGVDTHEK